MDHHQKGMARKWERHYMEMRSTVGWAFILFGAVFAITLAYLWPQLYSAEVFNSRLAYHLILDIEDYWTCDKDYKNFVIDEPTAEEFLYQVFIFNISNAPDVLQKGYKPEVNEVGPYAYQKKTYKYEIYFDPDDTTRVQFKEYSMLIVVPSDNAKACERMFHRMARSDSLPQDPCVNGHCDCHNHDEIVTVINPLFMKLIWDESSHSVLAYFSVDVFTQVKSLLENEFVVATKAHLVPYAIGEIYQFRWQMQAYRIIHDMYTNLRGAGYSNAQIAFWHSNHTRNFPLTGSDVPPAACGLTGYKAPIEFGCPIDGYYYAHLTVELEMGLNSEYVSQVPPINEADVPSSIHLFENPTSEVSFLNEEFGVSGYLALAWYFNSIGFNAAAGHTMFNSTEANEMLQRRSRIYAEMAYGPGYTHRNYLGSRLRILATMEYVGQIYEKNIAVTKDLVYQEFEFGYAPVPCNGLGLMCVWQWGYMVKYHGTKFALSDATISSMIDLDTKLNTNPINMQYLGDSASFYNSYVYCTKVYRDGIVDPCSDLGFSSYAATVKLPAGIYGISQGVNMVNTTFLSNAYNKLPATEIAMYFQTSCNLSALVHEIYPGMTQFHDHYVVRYLNKYRDVGFTHDFSVGKWEEIGYAQFGGGFITNTLTFVRATYQIKRDGMWYFGKTDLWAALMEFGVWAIKVGYPQTWIYDPLEAKALLEALADRSENGVDFRRHVVYTGTTFIGDGKPENYINAVGDVGELAFTSEANRGDFLCPGQYYERACQILGQFFDSSNASAIAVNTMFQTCKSEVFAGNPWVVFCERLETSMTSPQQGIQITMSNVYGNPHPYRKSRGNVLYEMMFSLTTDLKVKAGLWCARFEDCDYAWGGMFTSSSVRQILFEGFTEPSVLQYLNMKHESQHIRFRCAENSVGECGKELLRCNEAGIIMSLPGGAQRNVSYALTQKDEYFAPYLEVVGGTNELIWEHSMNATTRERAAYIKFTQPNNVVRVRNPFWTAFPAWDTDDTEFHKYFQCQKRVLGGLPNKYSSCLDTLNTGRKSVNESRNQLEYYGNDTIFFFKKPMDVNGSTYLHHPMNLWNGFKTYNYSYLGSKVGTEFFDMLAPRIFAKQYGLSLELNQNMFIYDWQKNVDLNIPIENTYTGRTFNRSLIVNVRRFVEWKETWLPLSDLGIPKDSYGMRYFIPKDMASLERLTGFPLFIGTPHAYGNKLWGGTEYGHVQGYAPRAQSQRTFVDFDPVTGKSMREVLRQQINIRVEKGCLYPNVFSSQDRCIAPTKAFSANTGYGCFAYVPLMWTEDARVISNTEFYRMHDHFYLRPERASFLELIGTIVGSLTIFVGLCLVLNEMFHRRNFKRRVYVD